jgi:hypothetical protein
MSTNFPIKKATRQNVKPLIAIYAESGCGKTMSALLMARGIAGPNGKIILADSESGRGSLYADVIPGGYETFDLCAPFSPQRYIDAIDVMEEAGADVGIIDSGSHEWEGIGGVLEMAGDNEERTKKAGLHNWKQPKLEHARFVQRLLRTKMPVIVCLRAKHKSRQTKNAQGKTEIVKDDFASPIQAEDFIFEATAHLEIMPDHTIRLTKCSHPDLGKCFPEDFKRPINVSDGEAIARWSVGAAPAPSQPASKPVQNEPDDMMLEIKEATDDGELTRLAHESNNIEDADRKKRIKTAIQAKSKSMGLKWSIQNNGFYQP